MGGNDVLRLAWCTTHTCAPSGNWTSPSNTIRPLTICPMRTIGKSYGGSAGRVNIFGYSDSHWCVARALWSAAAKSSALPLWLFIVIDSQSGSGVHLRKAYGGLCYRTPYNAPHKITCGTFLIGLRRKVTSIDTRSSIAARRGLRRGGLPAWFAARRGRIRGRFRSSLRFRAWRRRRRRAFRAIRFLSARS